MPSFLAGSAGYFAAVAAVAAGPVIIHLLNRRRFRVVNWAAMDFLREALQRNRKILQMRDLLLLALRTACLLLFGLALARPYFDSSSTAVDPDQPIHAVLILDNSLSMSYEDGTNTTLLNVAKDKAREFVDQLPQHSQISIIPLCGASGGYSLDPFRTKEDALDAIKKIKVVDRSGRISEALTLAKDAIDLVPKMAKRIVLIGDQQEAVWPAGSLGEELNKIPELQVVSVAPETTENTWVETFRIQDGIADIETPTTFVVDVGHQGEAPLTNVQVTLSIDNKEVSSQVIDLEPGQLRSVEFKHQLDVSVEPGKATFVPAAAKVRVVAGDGVAADRLEADNERFLSVPVVAALPVVFVDEYGRDESPQQDRIGETAALRDLLAPGGGRENAARQVIRIEQMRMDELNRENLQNVRLVVIAGVESPTNVDLLQQFILQGGHVLIAAGGNFDPKAWTAGAWIEGRGILPAPLAAETFGKRIEQLTKDDFFHLAFDSMRGNEYFMLVNESPDNLRDLYGGPSFFRAVETVLSDDAQQQLVEAEAKRIESGREVLDEFDKASRRWEEQAAAGKELTEAELTEKRTVEADYARVNPNWLLWADRSRIDDRRYDVDKTALLGRPRVLARFDNDLPFMTERKLGRGSVIMVASSLRGDWNTLSGENAFFMFDRIVRSKLHATMETPQNPRNFSSSRPAEIRVEPQHQHARFTVTRPDGEEQMLTVGALGADTYGVTVDDLTARGIYEIRGQLADDASADGSVASEIMRVPLAVNGPSDESNLTTINAEGLKQRAGDDTKVRWVGRGEQISMEGAQVWGSLMGVSFWKWLIGLVIVCLLVEMTVLAWPTIKRTATS